MNVPSEHDEQVAFLQWWKRNPKTKGDRIFAVPNGGHRSKRTASMLKAEGVCPGVPDLFVPVRSLWIEMKRQKGGVLSKNQKDWIDYLQLIGNTVIVARGWEDAVRQIEEIYNE